MPTPGWINSRRRATLPADWRRRVAAVRDRAEGRCEGPGWSPRRVMRLPGDRCPYYGAECDHIADPLDHDLSNLQWLCHEHHTTKTIQDRRTRRRSDRRPPERHPGLRGK